MELGFTGTQKGMTKKQILEIFDPLMQSIFVEESVYNVHHGDCIGADRDFHMLAQLLELPIIIHPPKNSSKRAFCKNYNAIREPEEYMIRNQHIIDETEGLIATPGEYTEQLRSGTWSTVRKGRKKQNYPIWIVFPDGSVKKE